MAAVNSTMLELGIKAPAFELPDTDGKVVSNTDFQRKKGLLVAFWCNHCPYVKHVRNAFIELATEWQKRGLGVVAIMSNDVENYPDDSPKKMKIEHQEFGYSFSYLFDADQKIAHAYQAACTPDFYLFDADHKLVYRGQFDASRPKNDIPVTGEDLNKAVESLLSGKTISKEQIPSIGCNIKWEKGNEPAYFQ